MAGISATNFDKNFRNLLSKFIRNTQPERMVVMSTNERIKKVRQTVGITQATLAKRIAVSASYYAAMECGTKKVNDRIIRLISTELNIDEHWLRTGVGSMFSEETDAQLARAMSIFRSLSPEVKECALIQLEALAELDGS